MARRVIFDPWLLLVTAFLIGGGWFMVGSASNYVALEFGKSPSAYGWRHMLHLLLGCVALLTMVSFPYQKLAERWVVHAVVIWAYCAFVCISTKLSRSPNWLRCSSLICRVRTSLDFLNCSLMLS